MNELIIFLWQLLIVLCQFLLIGWAIWGAWLMFKHLSNR